MSENKAMGIPYVPVLPKPKAQLVFIGRDPSPRTAEIVGVRGGNSAFINEIFWISGDTCLEAFPIIRGAGFSLRGSVSC